MRARALKLNMLTGWASELFTLVSGLVLPRLILSHFGSASNGLISAVSQFLGLSVVARAGIEAVVRAALYRPLAEQNIHEVSAVMAAARAYLRKTALIVAAYVGVLAVAYPLLAKGDYSWDFMFTMVLIMGSTAFANNCFGIQAKILLQADQKYYVPTLCALASHIAAFLLSVILIHAGCTITIVKLGAAAGALIDPLLLNLYVGKRYRLDRKAPPNALALNQRWDAFAQQIAVVVNDNIDLVLLTLFVDLREISVYTIHNMVVVHMKKLVVSCVAGINSTFGDMIARREDEHLRRTFRLVEWAFFAVCTVLFSTTAVMLVPFIRLYTDSVTDANYIRPAFAFAITLAAFMNCMRIPYQMLAEAAGHFRQTRNGAIWEIVLNVALSALCLYRFGVIGVIIGTLAASAVRTGQYALHAMKHILKLPVSCLIRSYGVYMLTFLIVVCLCSAADIPDIPDYFTWCVWAACTVIASALIVSLVSLINNREQLLHTVRRLSRRQF